MLKELDNKWTRGTFINIKDLGRVSDRAVTHLYEVTSRTNGALLGYIKWFAHWRQYSFFPVDCIMEKVCMRDIADFCEQRTNERRQKRNGKNLQKP